MRLLISLLVAAGALLATPSDTVTITSQTGSGALTVHKVGRAFPDDATYGIATCAQPYVGDTPVTAYQCTVKSRYSSGRARFAIIAWVYSITDGSSVTFNFRNTSTCNDTGGLSQAQMLAYDTGSGSGSWNAQIKATANPQGASTQATADARTMLSAGHWSYWLQGPILTEVIVEAPNTQADLFTYDFGWQNQRYTATTSSVSTSATSVAVFDATRIAALVTANGTTVLKIDNEQVLACAVVGNVISIGTAETCPSSAGRGYASTAVAGHVTRSTVGLMSHASDLWVDDSTGNYKSLHPYFVLDFWNRNGSPYPGVGVTAVVENAWSGKLQKLAYDVELWAGATAAKVYPSSGTKTVNHPAGSIWSKTVWSGTAHPFEYIDHNFEWLVYTKTVPHYDTTKAYVPTSWYTSFAASDKGDIADGSGYLGHGLMEKDFDGNTEGANLQTDEWLFLYNMGASCATAGSNCAKVNDILWGSSVEGGGGMAEVGMHVPYHVRDSGYSASAYYRYGGSTLAFGKWYSRDAHQTQLATLGANSYLTSAVGQIDTQGWVSTASPAISHMQEHAFLPYALTGDPRFLRELYYYAHTSTFAGGFANSTIAQWGVLKYAGYGNMRGEAWLCQQLGYAWWAAPDSSDEQTYFLSRLNDYTARSEGVLGITDGAFPPTDATCAGYVESTTSDRWCFGNQSLLGVTRPSGSNPLGLTASTYTVDAKYSTSTVSRLDYQFQVAYMVAAVARIVDLGYTAASRLPLGFGGYRMAATVHPDYNPFLTRFNQWPAVALDGSWITTMAGLKAGWNSNYQAISAVTDPLYTSYYYQCDSHAMQYQHRSVVAILYNDALTLPVAAGGSFTAKGSDAWTWLSDSSHMGPVCASLDPLIAATYTNVPIRWDHVPREAAPPIIALSVSPASLSFSGGNPAAQSVTATCDTADCAGTATVGGCTWATVAPSSATITTTGTTFTVTPSTTGLTTGTYACTLTITGADATGGSPAAVGLSLTVAPTAAAQSGALAGKSGVTGAAVLR